MSDSSELSRVANLRHDPSLQDGYFNKCDCMENSNASSGYMSLLLQLLHVWKCAKDGSRGGQGAMVPPKWYPLQQTFALGNFSHEKTTQQVMLPPKVKLWICL